MNCTHSQHTRWASAREARRARRAGRIEREALARELAAFRSPAELIELSAMLERYADIQTEPIRDLVNWGHAA
jgi:hypothetical protein